MTPYFARLAQRAEVNIRAPLSHAAADVDHANWDEQTTEHLGTPEQSPNTAHPGQADDDGDAAITIASLPRRSDTAASIDMVIPRQYSAAASEKLTPGLMAWVDARAVDAVDATQSDFTESTGERQLIRDSTSSAASDLQSNRSSHAGQTTFTAVREHRAARPSAKAGMGTMRATGAKSGTKVEGYAETYLQREVLTHPITATTSTASPPHADSGSTPPARNPSNASALSTFTHAAPAASMSAAAAAGSTAARPRSDAAPANPDTASNARRSTTSIEVSIGRVDVEIIGAAPPPRPAATTPSARGNNAAAAPRPSFNARRHYLRGG